jgi:hypothetical protein
MLRSDANGGAELSAQDSIRTTEAPSLIERGSRCEPARDALDVAAVAFFADNGRHPSDIADMTAYFTVPSGVQIVTGVGLQSTTWTLRMTGGAEPPTFTCTER